MKKSILTIALAFAFAVPFAETSLAEVRGIVSAPDSSWLTGSNPAFNTPVSISMSHNPYDLFGGLISVCRIQSAGKAVLLERKNHAVKVRMTTGNCRDKVGWIPISTWRPEQNSTARQATNAQKVFTGGRWGTEVPVFKSRGMYYSARTSMDREGHYRGQSRSVACKLRVGTSVEFVPYRDWGVGQVKSGNCKGWTDREVIR